jgi:hypothetical protein
MGWAEWVSVMTRDKSDKNAAPGESLNPSDPTTLSPADHAAFFKALDEVAKPNAKLQTALDRHAATIISRS